MTFLDAWCSRDQIQRSISIYWKKWIRNGAWDAGFEEEFASTNDFGWIWCLGNKEFKQFSFNHERSYGRKFYLKSIDVLVIEHDVEYD